MIDIDYFYSLVEGYGLVRDGKHLLLPEGSKISRGMITRKLFEALGDSRVTCGRFRLYKPKGICFYHNCVSPSCYNFYLNSSLRDSILEKEDIIDLADRFRIDRYFALGHKAYYEEFNRSEPEGFKLSPEDFKTVANYATHMEGRVI